MYDLILKNGLVALPGGRLHSKRLRCQDYQAAGRDGKHSAGCGGLSGSARVY